MDILMIPVYGCAAIIGGLVALTPIIAAVLFIVWAIKKILTTN